MCAGKQLFINWECDKGTTKSSPQDEIYYMYMYIMWSTGTIHAVHTLLLAKL